MRSEANEVVPGLLVGSKPPPGHHDDVDVIVLTALEYQPRAELFPGAEVLYAPFDDAPTRPMHEDEIATALGAAARVARRLRAGRRVLVTCAMGMNRSALVAALAMQELYPSMGADEIIGRIRHARGSWALSNPNFRKLLRLAVGTR
jgi:protein-tyrosine phosphatase